MMTVFLNLSQTSFLSFKSKCQCKFSTWISYIRVISNFYIKTELLFFSQVQYFLSLPCSITLLIPVIWHQVGWWIVDLIWLHQARDQQMPKQLSRRIKYLWEGFKNNFSKELLHLCLMLCLHPSVLPWDTHAGPWTCPALSILRPFAQAAHSMWKFLPSLTLPIL